MRLILHLLGKELIVHVEAEANRPAPLPLRLHTHLALGFCFHREDAALEGGPLLRRAGREQLRALMPTQRSGCILFQDVLRPPRRSGQSSGRHASRPGLERTLSQALLELLHMPAALAWRDPDQPCWWLLPPCQPPGLERTDPGPAGGCVPPATRPGLERTL
ncbi:hypothetical protein QTO34_000033 [Cnephaeus nilssonii]|uniref:Uncharacterized protein n=1 Tax=Cnephaeus nilssonii TaxID=3371016 RepID=A0AA40IAU2_CNENI|nr:hypothetical protein QTO34_000033 [Eptesicus nilssonii]